MNKHPLILEIFAHAAVLLAAAVSACLLYQKFILSGWAFGLALGGAIFAFIAVAVVSEGFGLFLANLIGLFLQSDKSTKELKSQFIFCTIGALVTASGVFGIAYVSINNIISVQSVKRESQTVNINALPQVKPFYDALNSLELALQGANNELQWAQERFKSYEGTNQYQNKGKANQATITAQGRKDRLEGEVAEARKEYQTVYNTELAKGTTVLDRADNGKDSKLHIAGMFEIGAPIIALIAIMLSAYSNAFTVVYVTGYRLPVPKKDVDDTENKGNLPVLSQNTEVSTVPSPEKTTSQLLGTPPDQIPLEVWIVRCILKPKDVPQVEISKRFNLRPYYVSRLVKRTANKLNGEKVDYDKLLQTAREVLSRSDGASCT